MDDILKKAVPWSVAQFLPTRQSLLYAASASSSAETVFGVCPYRDTSPRNWQAQATDDTALLAADSSEILEYA